MNKDLNLLDDEQAVEIFKALANQTRVSILQMLKDPDSNFSTQAHVIKDEGFEGGVCVSDIRSKTGISQSTTSQYLSILLQCGLVEMKRIGQWTYYRRNEETIKRFERYICQNI
ncbi:ArsR/SmtB family transcription factor [Jeotgalibacillus soli]|uniref:ArsR family transcriptional regulator n=1 Tax=Jeotgalibacillus soli TaxID=889306 RepID=A0A0C2R4Q3_9BACL|nr:metalloregulator ArsR/SmtB family transcription factor [Jeotgalibacillus soli]KIL45255.1 ArsR family transcriptional regulator [Jeotgalibacillus soli]